MASPDHDHLTAMWARHADDVYAYARRRIGQTSAPERIWLPFIPFVLAAGAALSGGRQEVGAGSRWQARRRQHASRFTPVQGWIALQVAYTVVLEVVVRTGW